MEEAKEKRGTVCLECGDEIRYGRSDKKFCCEECKNRWHNRQSQGSRHFRQKVTSALEKNYIILDALRKTTLRGIPVSDMESMGFRREFFTSFRKGATRDIYMCYDIRYSVSAGTVTSIVREKDFDECGRTR